MIVCRETKMAAVSLSVFCRRATYSLSKLRMTTGSVLLRNLSQPARTNRGNVKSLEQRLADGEYVLCAEGYLLALARMGYIAHGVWVAEFILDQPEVLRNVHYEFVHAGSDVTEAFQYFTHRERMRRIGREDDLEKINRTALKIAREVADETGTLMAGGVSNCNVYEKGDKESKKEVRAIFEEQVRWAKEEGVDYMIAETLPFLGEAEIALDVIKSFDLPAVVTLATISDTTADDVPTTKALETLLEKGATLVGSNCYRGPETMLDVIEEAVKVIPPEKIATLPIAYRTNKIEPTFFTITDSCCAENNPVYPHGLDAFYVSTKEIVKFTERCMELGLKYMGICCGNTGNYTRAMAETLGRTPPASRYHDPTHMGRPPVTPKI